MARLSLPIVLLVTLALAGCGQSTPKAKQDSSPSQQLTVREKVKLAAYNNVQAVIRKDGQLLCDNMTFNSVKKMMARGRANNWPGSHAKGDRAQLRNCPRVAERFLGEINHNQTQTNIYRNMADQVVKAQRVNVYRNPKKKTFVAQVVIPQMIEKNGQIVINPNGQKNTLSLEFYQGRWLTSQCKWGKV